jgi:hypothetical protein
LPLVVTPAPGGSLAAVVNAASLRTGPVAPGEIITFFGTNLAGLLQVNAFVPDGLASGPQTVVLTVGNNSNSSQTITVTVQ